MLYRCYNPDHPQYHLYGGRGIGVCDEWREAPDGVLQFARDMGNKPAGHSLGLLDFNSDFGPGNCEWVPAGHVARRRRDLRIVTWNGESRAVVEWAEILGIPAKTLKWRLDHWQDVDRAFTQPLRDWANKGAPRKSKERP